MARKLAPYGLFPLSILKNKELTASERLVFIALCGHFNYETEKAWPSIATLIEETHLTRPTVVACIKKLVSVGVVLKNGSAGKVSEYFIPSIYADELNDLTTPVKQFNYYQLNDLTTPVKLFNPNKLIEQANTNKLIEQANISPLPPQTSAPDPEPKPAEPVRPKRKQKPKTPPEIVAEYERIYEQYPYSEHNDKARGLKNYEKLRASGISFEELQNSVVNYAAARQGEDPKYTKGVGNFFSDRLGGFWQKYKEAPRDVQAPVSFRENHTAKSGAEEFYEDLKNSGLLWGSDEYDR